MPRRRKRKAMPEDAIFALDIGTRKVAGLVGIQNGDGFIIRAAELLEHEERAMLDGQIHDISRVVSEVSEIKEKLEEKVGYSLTKVSVAAAGRVLKTCRIKVERDIEEGREIDSHLVGAMEMEAIQRAQMQIDDSTAGKDTGRYFCVGHSVVSYYLNDYVISSLIGHKGRKAGVEVIATFLPEMVVDSLYTVMERAGLEVTFLTLEPIAALNVAIPKELRLLNLALVDIGAGTSDIAVTKSGTIIAYDMVPVAGDEMTEAIAQNFLVDFNTAERIKRDYSAGKTDIQFTDVLDNHVSVGPDDVASAVRPVVEQLAGIISERIIACNGGKSPNAVFLVGGGSRTPELARAIADKTGLPKERVAVRDRSIAKNVVMEAEFTAGPDSITPLGILVTTGLFRGSDFYFVTVNGKSVKVFNSYKMRVADVLALAGFNPEQLLCKSGRRLRFFLNGESRTVPGGTGKPAEIKVNGRPESLNGIVSPGDRLTVVPAENGEDARAVCGDLLSRFPPAILKHDGEVHRIYPKIRINGEPADETTQINDGDRVEITMDCTVSDIARRFGIDTEQYSIEINGSKKEPAYRIQCGEVIECRPGMKDMGAEKEPEPEKNASVQEVSQESHDFGMTVPVPGNSAASGSGVNVTVNGKRMNLPLKDDHIIFVDIFNYIDFDLSKPKGSIVLKLNGRDAGYTDPIKDGDVIDIYWQK